MSDKKKSEETGLRSLLVIDTETKETILLSGARKYTIDSEGLVKSVEYARNYKEGVEDLFRDLQKKALSPFRKTDDGAFSREISSYQKYIIQIVKTPSPEDEESVPF